jgi:hypothetical protein
MRRPRVFLSLLVLWLVFLSSLGHSQVRIAPFDVDATPPMGSPMAYDPVKRLDEMSLRCRGIAILGGDKPIVLCAVDWIGIANEGHDAFRDKLAEAAGTTRDRVAVHALHQHDAPGCDFTAEKLIKDLGIEGYSRFEGEFHRETIELAAAALRKAIEKPIPVSHYGYGEASVDQVASNRRVEVKDGKVGRMRGSSCKIQELIDLPEGVIDPMVSVLAFWNGEQPVAILSTYACHPQSYYRLGIPSPDFPGIARFIRGQDVNAALHVHFNGAGGNIAAGKYNDGSQPNRMTLATRLAQGMRAAYEKAERRELKSGDLGWRTTPLKLPLAKHLDQATLVAKLRETTPRGYISLADQLAWVKRVEAGHAIDLTCLSIGDVRMLHLPGELFVEYQLAAKAIRKDLHVMMAAYGDYGPGYIGTARSYEEGGYETAPTSSNVAPESEEILLNALSEILKN